MKIKLFSGTSREKIEQDVNQFIRDKDVINIKYSSYYVPKEFNRDGKSVKTICVDRVLVIYKEGEINVL